METFSYIMTVSTSQAAVEVFLAIRNIAGTGRAQYGRSGDFGNVELWIVPKSKKSKEELIAQLQTVPFIQTVSVVELSKPVTNKELLEVRELFNSLGWDTDNVKDEELLLFINARIQGKYTYLLEVVHDKDRARDKISVIRAEEHPHFSSEWLANDGYEEDMLDRELTVDDLKIESISIELAEEEEPPPLEGL